MSSFWIEGVILSPPLRISRLIGSASAISLKSWVSALFPLNFKCNWIMRWWKIMIGRERANGKWENLIRMNSPKGDLLRNSQLNIKWITWHLVSLGPLGRRWFRLKIVQVREIVHRAYVYGETNIPQRVVVWWWSCGDARPEFISLKLIMIEIISRVEYSHNSFWNCHIAHHE